MKFTQFLFCVAMIVRCNDVLCEEESAKREVGIKVTKARFALYTTDESSITEDATELTVLKEAHENFPEEYASVENELAIAHELKLSENKKALACQILFYSILLDKSEQDTSNKNLFDFVGKIESNNPECKEILEEFFVSFWCKKTNK